MAAPTQAIDRLRKKLEKEPNSLIFLQLAEEYRKEGYYEDALEVSREGCRRHPGYWSAHVALGRIYHEMGDIPHAREELEQVIKAIPDNLLANKLLGAIYLESGRRQDALKRYRILRMITPHDDEVNRTLRRLEGAEDRTPPPDEYADVPVQEETQQPQEEVFPDVPEEFDITQVPLEKSRSVDEAEQLNAYRSIQPEVVQATIPEFLEPPPVDETPIVDLLETAEDGREPFRTTPMDLEPPAEIPSVSPIEFDAASEGNTSDLEAGYAEIANMLLESEQEEGQPVRFDVERANPGEFKFDEIDNPDLEPMTEPEQKSAGVDITQPIGSEQVDGEDADELTTETLAELYVRQGHVEKAIKVYQKMLLNDPGNQKIVMRLHELNPVEAFIASTARQEMLSEVAPAKSREWPEPVSGLHVRARNGDPLSDERKRKISTLENWLVAIRRDRS